MNKNKTKKITFYALLIALAMIFSYVETLIPMPVFVPGMKVGFANIITVLALYKLGGKDAAVIAIIRILLAALLFGSVFSLAYSLAGGLFSLVVMILLKKTNLFSLMGVSIAGGVCHNIAQTGVAAFLLETSAFLYYLPTLLITGCITGCIIGLVSALIIKKLKLTWLIQ